MVTITALSTSRETCNAAHSAPPDEMPAKMPSSRASRRVVSSASACDTSITRSTRFQSQIFGRYCGGHLRMPGICEPSEGWQPTIWIFGFFSLKNCEQPMMVPVVPMLETKCVMRPCVSRQISGPVPS